MPKYKIKYSPQYKAIEAFSVLIAKNRVGRSYGRKDIVRDLANPEIYGDFLKLCLENDRSKDLTHFRKGLLHVVRAIGVKPIAEEMGVARITLYRMLSKSGNPNFSTLVSLLRVLDLSLWVVDRGFLSAGHTTRRYGKELPNELPSDKKWIQF